MADSIITLLANTTKRRAFLLWSIDNSQPEVVFCALFEQYKKGATNLMATTLHELFIKSGAHYQINISTEDFDENSYQQALKGNSAHAAVELKNLFDRAQGHVSILPHAPMEFNKWAASAARPGAPTHALPTMIGSTIARAAQIPASPSQRPSPPASAATSAAPNASGGTAANPARTQGKLPAATASIVGAAGSLANAAHVSPSPSPPAAAPAATLGEELEEKIRNEKPRFQNAREDWQRTKDKLMAAGFRFHSELPTP